MSPKRTTSLGLAILIGATACTQMTLRRADNNAGKGDWSRALAQYRAAAVDRPGDTELADRIRAAEREVALHYVKKAEEAREAGRLGDAADLWKKASDLAPHDEEIQATLLREVADSAASLEYYGDICARFSDWPEAVEAYGALLLVEGKAADVQERYREAKREYERTLVDERDAKRLSAESDLAANLRALQNDPAMPGAFDRVAMLRKELQARTDVDLGALKLIDNGNKDFGGALAQRLTARLSDYPPYGPTGSPAAVKAWFSATVEAFHEADVVTRGVDVRPSVIPQPTEPIANPALAVQSNRIAALQAELRKLQADLKKSLPARGARPVASLNRRTIPFPMEKARLAGLAAARRLDDKRTEISLAKAALASMPRTVPPAPLPPTWDLPWTDTTRTTEARVRFEIRESDFEVPIAITLTFKVEHKDRQHAGNAKQGVAEDALQLPSSEQIGAELADRFAAEGPRIIAAARARRVDLRLAEEAGRALGGHPGTIFMVGPEQMPDAAVIALTANTDYAAN